MARLIETITEYREQPDCRTAAQMELICCEEAPALVCCEIARPWDGYSVLELQEMHNVTVDEQGRDSEGRYVYWEFLDRENPCGEEVIDYDLTPGNCCDDVDDIVIDREDTPDVLPARYSINIYWDGGRYPMTVRTSNGATYFANYKREIVVTGGGYLTLFATEFFCGATVVTFSDGCTSDSLGIRSDQGQWEYAGSTCVLSGAVPDSTAGGVYQTVFGMWKQVEQAASQYWGGSNRAYCDPREFYPEEQAEGCLSGFDSPCDNQYCQYVAGLRPEGTENDICLGIDPLSNSSISSVICTLGDGAVIGTHALWSTAFGTCVYKNEHGGRAPIGGAVTLRAGFYRQTQSLSAYKWVC